MSLRRVFVDVFWTAVRRIFTGERSDCSIWRTTRVSFLTNCDSAWIVLGLVDVVTQVSQASTVIMWAVEARCDLRRPAIENLVKWFSKNLVSVVTWPSKHTTQGACHQLINELFRVGNPLNGTLNGWIGRMPIRNFGGFCAPTDAPAGVVTTCRLAIIKWLETKEIPSVISLSGWKLSRDARYQKVLPPHLESKSLWHSIQAFWARKLGILVNSRHCASDPSDYYPTICTTWSCSYASYLVALLDLWLRTRIVLRSGQLETATTQYIVFSRRHAST